MKWMVAMCALVVTSGLVRAQVASNDSTPSGTTSSEQQPPSDLLPGVDELSPESAVPGDRAGMTSAARAGRLSRYRRFHGHAAFSSRFARHHHGRHHLAAGRRGGHYVRHARFERGHHFAHHHYHRQLTWSRRSLAHRHRRRRHLVLSPYGPYGVPAAFYGPPGPYYGPYGPPYDPF